MSLFGLSHTSDRYGVVIDVGSGSVLASIVHSELGQKRPTIVWSHREHAPLRNIDSLEKSSKAVMTSLVTALMQLDGEGRKALHEYNSEAKLSELQCGISAPWSYTVTKDINYKQPKSFLITKELIDDLVVTAQKKIETDLKENEALQNLGLQVIARATLGLIANGYQVKRPVGEKTSELSISHTTVVSQKYLVDAIEEMHKKLFPQNESKKLSFILMLYTIANELLSKPQDTCLVDITYEATEIGVVRDNILKYSTHTPFGSFSLAREISAATNVPLHEAFGYLHTEKPYSFIETLSTTQKSEVEAVFEAYLKRVTELFYETGDNLSIPRHISLHTDLNSETLFLDLVEKAAKRSTKSNPHITAISKEIIKQTYGVSNTDAKDTLPTDTALLVSAQFFHMQDKHQTFKYL